MIKNLKRKLMVLLLLSVLLPVYPAAALAQVHTVTKGESIYLISKAYGVDQYALRYVNGLWTDSIYIGQQLNIPTQYTVQKGDTLIAIAAKFGTNYLKIKEINKLTNANILYIGQKLYIPAAVTAPVQPVAKTNFTDGMQVSRGGRISAADFDALARIITAEADSESYETQVAVGAVVLNRVDSPLFPNTIRGVIYQVDETGRYQFEPVLNGWINNPPSETAKHAAIDALNGSDPSSGSLYFFESWVTNKYLTSRPVSKIMDSFTFTY